VLAIRLLATSEELEEARGHSAINRVRDPRGDLLSEVTGEISVAGESARPEWLTGIMVGGAVQFEAAEEGTYTIEVVIDDSSASLPIHIVLGSP
jgi:hypothetical protein